MKYLTLAASAIAGAAITAAVLFFCWHDYPASLADDSAGYLMMARHFSPYSSPTATVEYFHQFNGWPPLFPMFLAITGGGESYLAAHLAVAVAFLASLSLQWSIIHRNMDSRAMGWFALALLLVFPGIWISILGILSETLYTLLTLLAIWYWLMASKNGERKIGVGQSLVLGLIFSLVLLTRTIGISLIAAYLVTEMWRSWSGRHYGRLLWAAAIAIFAMAVVQLWNISHPTALYANDVRTALSLIASGPPSILLQLVSENSKSLLGASNFFLTGYQDGPGRILFLALFYLIFFVGLLSRLRRCSLDACYLITYAGILLLWPFPSQMVRFLFPAAPIVVISLLEGVLVLAVGAPRILGLASNTGIEKSLRNILVVALAGLAVASNLTFFREALDKHLAQRGRIDAFNNIAEYYRGSGEYWVARAKLFSDVMRNMEFLRSVLPENATVLSTRPAFMMLFSDHIAYNLKASTENSNFTCEIKSLKPDFVYVSQVIEPENRRGLAALKEYESFSDPVFFAQRDEQTYAVLLRVDQRRLESIALADCGRDTTEGVVEDRIVIPSHFEWNGLRPD